MTCKKKSRPIRMKDACFQMQMEHMMHIARNIAHALENADAAVVDVHSSEAADRQAECDTNEGPQYALVRDHQVFRALRFQHFCGKRETAPCEITAPKGRHITPMLQCRAVGQHVKCTTSRTYHNAFGSERALKPKPSGPTHHGRPQTIFTGIDSACSSPITRCSIKKLPSP
jgi:hypothetical protein